MATKKPPVKTPPKPVTTPKKPITLTPKASPIQSPFFSLQGQKERLANVGATLKAAVTGGGVAAHTSSPTANKALSITASHPFLTAGVAAGGITAIRHAPAVISGLRTLSTGAIKTAPKGLGMGLGTVGLIGGGLLAGSLLGGSRATTAPQSQAPTQQVSPTIQPYQETAPQDLGQVTNYLIRDSPGARIMGSPEQVASQSPVQYTPSLFSPSQTAAQEQTAGAGGNDWLTYALIAAGVYIFARGK